jgi:tetratricopeptide (TPR) repeat protein
VHIYGEDDDALRIAAEIAAGLGSCEREAAQTCLAPESSWSQRHKAVKHLLDERRGDRATRPFLVVDLDALPASVPEQGDELWDDRSFLVARSSIRALLLTHACSTENVIFVRTRPERRLTNELDARGIVCADDTEDDPADIMPFTRPLARWLLDRGRISQAALGHWVRTIDEPELSQLVVEAAYESLTQEDRATLGRLAVLRGPQPINGAAGPFKLGDSAGTLALPRAQVEALRTAGWLQSAVGRDGFVLPNAVRKFVGLREQLTSDLRTDHLEIAKAGFSRIDRAGVSEAIETHHHAIASGNSDLAIRTGRHFLNDLRRLAFDLSAHGEEYAKAAKLYQAILERDSKDAYAHEYLAYNLQMMNPEAQPTDEILDHYDTARRIERGNPLFLGRWLACRASRGENVATELKRLIRRFHPQGLDAVSFLARTPLRKMAPEHRDEVAREFRWLLERDPDLRKLLA